MNKMWNIYTKSMQNIITCIFQQESPLMKRISFAEIFAEIKLPVSEINQLKEKLC